MKNLSFVFVILLCGSNIFAQNEFQILINKAQDGSTITFPEGEYIIDEPLIISNRKNLVVKGENNCKIYLTDLYEYVFLIENSEGTTIENLYLSHHNPLKEYRCNGGVISITQSSKTLIDNCELEGSGTIGVWTSDIIGLEVNHCYIHDNTFNAFYFNQSERILIHNSLIEKNANFIQLYDVFDLEMSNNLIRDNKGYRRQEEEKPGLKKK